MLVNMTLHFQETLPILLKKKLDTCVKRTRMPPPSALSKMAPWLGTGFCQITIGQ